MLTPLAKPMRHLRPITDPCACVAPGSLLVLGRHELLQAKVGGVRVDVTAVERHLASLPGLAAAAARAWRHPRRPQDCLLAAYIVPSPAGGRGSAVEGRHQGEEPAEGALLQRVRAAAADALPPAARPSSYMLLTALPRSAAGKLLRSELPKPAALEEMASQQPVQAREQQRQQERAPHKGPLPSESRVMAAFTSALAGGGAPAAAPRLEATSDFFVAGGGDSLAAAAAAGALGIDVRLVFAYPTARALAAALAKGASAGPEGARAEAAPRPGAGGRGDKEGAEGLVPVAKRQRRVVEVPPASAGPGAGAPGPAAAADTAGEQGGAACRDRLGLQDLLSQAVAGIIIGPAGTRHVAWLPTPAAGPPAAASEGSTPDADATADAAAAGAPAPQVLWRKPLGRCVDAAPELVELQLAPAGDRAAADGPRRAQTLALACSHSGMVACFDVAGGGGGACHWRTQLAGRCDAGLAVDPRLREVAVACSGGRLACLALASGALLREVACGGELRAAPAADAWAAWGWWWAGTHGRELVAVQPGDGGALLRWEHGSASAPAVAQCECARRTPLHAPMTAHQVPCKYALVTHSIAELYSPALPLPPPTLVLFPPPVQGFPARRLLCARRLFPGAPPAPRLRSAPGRLRFGSCARGARAGSRGRRWDHHRGSQGGASAGPPAAGRMGVSWRGAHPRFQRATILAIRPLYCQLRRQRRRRQQQQWWWRRQRQRPAAGGGARGRRRAGAAGGRRHGGVARAAAGPAVRGPVRRARPWARKAARRRRRRGQLRADGDTWELRVLPRGDGRLSGGAWLMLAAACFAASTFTSCLSAMTQTQSRPTAATSDRGPPFSSPGQLWRVDLGAGPISAAPAPAGSGRVLMCCSGGALAVLGSNGGNGATTGGGGVAAGSSGPGGNGHAHVASPRLLACAALPAHLFSSPAVTMRGPAALCVLGCRDDHLYCLRI
jgi:hypothetical protein